MIIKIIQIENTVSITKGNFTMELTTEGMNIETAIRLFIQYQRMMKS